MKAPTRPPGSEFVIIVGTTGAAVIAIESCFVSLPASFVALTVKVAVPAVVGVPEITPELLIYKPAGSVPESIFHVMGASPEAASVALYSAPITPSGSPSVPIVGATGTAVTVTVATPETELSTTDVARTVSVAAAVSSAATVSSPLLAICVPALFAPSTVHITVWAGLFVPLTVALNCWVVPCCTPAAAGSTVTSVTVGVCAFCG